MPYVSAECPVVDKDILILIYSQFFSCNPILWPLGLRVMNFKISLFHPLHMLHTKFDQDNPSSFREEAENVRMLMHDPRRQTKTDCNRSLIDSGNLKDTFIHTEVSTRIATVTGAK